jgi:hypothetical protein
LNPGGRGGKPATNRLSYGAAYKFESSSKYKHEEGELISANFHYAAEDIFLKLCFFVIKEEQNYGLLNLLDLINLYLTNFMELSPA